MDLAEVRSVVREILWEFQENHLDDKECPKCMASCTMVKVSVQPDDPEEKFVNKWRCLNCLGLFTEGLESVE